MLYLNTRFGFRSAAFRGSRMPFGLLVEVTCVISTSDTPLVTRNNLPPVPQSAAPMFSNSTFVTRM